MCSCAVSKMYKDSLPDVRRSSTLLDAQIFAVSHAEHERLERQ
jgi:hypothetical protein